MDRSVELEIRQDVKKINEKVTELQVSLTEEVGKIRGDLKVLKSRQNTSSSIFKMALTAIIAIMGGYFGGNLPR